ncbi:CLUMA_CG004807, isoform A, partial [Clunio marinus]
MNFISNRKREDLMKKSVNDLVSSSQDAINQAVSMTTSAIKDINLRRSPSVVHKQLEKSKTSYAASEALDSNSEVELQSINEANNESDGTNDSKRSSSLNVSKLAERAKKKAWYSAIYPSYKSRDEDFKKLFNVSDDERLVVDYSCAIQKDILVHGRLYVSQSSLCFHANIIVYETRFIINWKDVTGISKEKVAKVIPNAILITTESEKYFLTSFASRDKAYVILFRLWQNALMDKPMNPQELWQSVHSCYGEQLGLTSDDEDYIDPFEAKVSNESISEEPKASSSSSGKLSDKKLKKETKRNSSSSSSSPVTKETLRDSTNTQQQQQPIESIKATSVDTKSCISSETCPTDMSGDSSDSENTSKMDFVNDAECNSMHEGRQLVHTILPISIESVFGLLFHKSKFFSDFHKMRKTTDLKQGDWEDMPDGTKQRIISLTVAITQVVGPKSSHVTETQVMRSCSKAGQLYSIDATSVNAGIPYADSFYVLLHYCMKRTVDDSTVMSVHAQIKYKKSVWGVIKGFIEKNTWLGLEEFYESLSKALMDEYCLPPAKAKSRRTRKGSSIPNPLTSQPTLPIKSHENHETMPTSIRHVSGLNAHQMMQTQKESKTARNKSHKMLSWVVIFLLSTLIILNIMLYVKLWKLDERQDNDFESKFDFLKNSPKSPEEWLNLFKIQEELHSKEMKTWQKVIQSAIDLLKKTEQSLSELQNLILAYRGKSSDRMATLTGLFSDEDSIMAGNGYDDLISKLFMIDTKLREVCTHFKLKSIIPLKNTVAELEELSELLSSTLQNNKENSFQEKAKPYFLRENPLRSIRKDAMSLPFKELQNVSNNGSISKPLSKMKPNQSETRKMCDVCKLYDNTKMKSMKKCSNPKCNMSWIHSDCIKTLNSLNQK